MSELKPCPFCGAEVEVLSDMHCTWGLIKHRDGCLFPNFRNHEIPEHDFEAWNTRHNPEEDALPMTDENMAAHGWKRIETCKVESSYLDELMNDMRISLSCGHDIRDFEPPKFCPECGRKVVDG